MTAEQTAAEKPKKIRAFIALKVPPSWESSLAELQIELKSTLNNKACKWTKPEQIHITLRFLGYILPDEAVAISRRIQDEVVPQHAPFELRSEGLGCFPNVRRPRVLWAGITGDTSALAALQTSVTEATRSFGEPPEDRPFKAHLTLARIQQADRSAVPSLEKIILRPFSISAAWNVTELIFMQSHLSPHGATYDPIATWALG